MEAKSLPFFYEFFDVGAEQRKEEVIKIIVSFEDSHLFVFEVSAVKDYQFEQKFVNKFKTKSVLEQLLVQLNSIKHTEFNQSETLAEKGRDYLTIVVDKVRKSNA